MALLTATLGLLVSILAVYKNGVSHSNGFAGLLCATRSETLSALTAGLSLATRPLDKAMGKIYLKFGLLEHPLSHESETLVPHTAFGLESEVCDIRPEKGRR
jgi:hypothetical protein